MRTRFDETPQWEFCEGFLAALVCCRGAIPQAEYFDVLLGIGETDDMPGEGSFADAAQRARFLEIRDERMHEVKTALDTPTESLDTDTAYHPEVLGVRGAMAALSDEDRAAMPAWLGRRALARIRPIVGAGIHARAGTLAGRMDATPRQEGRQVA